MPAGPEPVTTGVRCVSLREAAEYAGVKYQTLRSWIVKGYLPAHRIGPRLLKVSLDDVDQMRIPFRSIASARRRSA